MHAISLFFIDLVGWSEGGERAERGRGEACMYRMTTRFSVTGAAAAAAAAPAPDLLESTASKHTQHTLMEPYVLP